MRQGVADRLQLRARHRLSLATSLKIGGFLGLCAAALYLHRLPWSHWNRLYELALAFAVASYAALILRARLRNAAMIVASVALSLTLIELCALVSSAPPVDINTPGYNATDPVLGWQPGQPGVYHHRKLDGKTGAALFDVDYTIDANRHRQVISAPAGPTVAFFGDSMTFGAGVSDADTLPQAFADITERRWRVLNLAVSGYGPQQFLRALETDLFRDQLAEARLFVFLTAPWHAERSACMRNFMFDAPSYILADGHVIHVGACRDHWWVRLQRLWTRTAMNSVFVEPVFGSAGRPEIELYVATLIRAGQLARDKYGAQTAILYMADPPYTKRAGTDDREIIQRLRDGGLLVIQANLDAKAFPGQPLEIPGDGHPTAVANRARALLVRDAMDALSR